MEAPLLLHRLRQIKRRRGAAKGQVPLTPEGTRQRAHRQLQQRRFSDEVSSQLARRAAAQQQQHRRVGVSQGAVTGTARQEGTYRVSKEGHGDACWRADGTAQLGTPMKTSRARCAEGACLALDIVATDSSALALCAGVAHSAMPTNPSSFALCAGVALSTVTTNADALALRARRSMSTMQADTAPFALFAVVADPLVLTNALAVAGHAQRPMMPAVWAGEPRRRRAEHLFRRGTLRRTTK